MIIMSADEQAVCCVGSCSVPNKAIWSRKNYPSVAARGYIFATPSTGPHVLMALGSFGKELSFTRLTKGHESRMNVYIWNLLRLNA